MELQWRNTDHIQLPNYNDFLNYTEYYKQQANSENLKNRYSEQIHYKQNDCSGKIRNTRRKRIAFTNLQRKELEKEFKKHKYLSEAESIELSTILGLSNTQVRNWFKNKRRKITLDEEKQLLNGSINSSCSSSYSSRQSLDNNTFKTNPENLEYSNYVEPSVESMLLHDYYKYMDPLYLDTKNVLTYSQM